MNADIALLSKMNIKTHQDYIKQNFQMILNAALGKGTTFNESSTIIDPSSGSVHYGGTMIITRTSVTRTSWGHV